MPEFEVNGDRFDPYKNFKFRVKWDGKFVAGVSKMTALKRTTEVVRHRHGVHSAPRLANDFHIRLGPQQSAYSLPEKRVIVSE